MIFLIGGSSHVGKTFMAQKLLEKYKYPYISLDHLKMGFIRTGKTELTVEDDYEMRYFLWPFAAEMIKTAIENKQNMIVEGCYIPGEWQSSFSEEYLKEIRCAFIVMSEKYLRENVAAVADYASVIEQRLDDGIDIERLIMCSKNFKNDAVVNGFPYIEIDSKYDEDELLNRLVSIMES